MSQIIATNITVQYPLKVGKMLGLGSIGVAMACKVTHCKSNS